MTLKNFKLALPRESGWWWLWYDVIDVSTTDDDEDPGTELFHQILCQNLTTFDNFKVMSMIRKTLCKR